MSATKTSPVREAILGLAGLRDVRGTWAHDHLPRRDRLWKLLRVDEDGGDRDLNDV